jgi:hypothetical protein
VFSTSRRKLFLCFCTNTILLPLARSPRRARHHLSASSCRPNPRLHLHRRSSRVIVHEQGVVARQGFRNLRGQVSVRRSLLRLFIHKHLPRYLSAATTSPVCYVRDPTFFQTCLANDRRDSRSSQVPACTQNCCHGSSRWNPWEGPSRSRCVKVISSDQNEYSRAHSKEARRWTQDRCRRRSRHGRWTSKARCAKVWRCQSKWTGIQDDVNQPTWQQNKDHASGRETFEEWR